MLLQPPEYFVPPTPDLSQREQQKAVLEPRQQLKGQSTGLLDGRNISLQSIAGPTYLTAQLLVQQVAYTVSDRIFTYSPESFDLDAQVRNWHRDLELSAHGSIPGLSVMQSRLGAASIALGYMLSQDYDAAKRHLPQTLLASSSTLQHLRPALQKLSQHAHLTNPLVLHIAAVDYLADSPQGLVTDYTSALTVGNELDMVLISSSSAHEAQHMSLLATVLAEIRPAMHIYDGIKVGRGVIRVIDVMDQNRLSNELKSINALVGSNKSRLNNEAKVRRAFRSFNDELGTSYGFFEYHGHTAPTQVLVVFGSVEASLTSQVASKLAQSGRQVGVVNVRLYRPFLEQDFLDTLPDSTETVTVLGQVQGLEHVEDHAQHSDLYCDVLAAITFTDRFTKKPLVLDLKYSSHRTWNPQSITELFQTTSAVTNDLEMPRRVSEATLRAQESSVQLLDQSMLQQYVFWNVDGSSSTSTPSVVAQLLSSNASRNVTVRTDYDNLTQGGISRTEIRSSKHTLEAPYAIEDADFVFVGSEKIFESIDVLSGLGTRGTLLVSLPVFTDDQIQKRLPEYTRQALVRKEINLLVLDPQASVSVQSDAKLETYLTQLAFMKIAWKDSLARLVGTLSAINGSSELLHVMVNELDTALRRVDISGLPSTAENEGNRLPLTHELNSNSFMPFPVEEPEPPSLLRDWQSVAKALAFNEAYNTKPALRPDLSFKTWTVHVKENRRLTPLTYDRNIFHIEFDLGDSGLKYEIGEALGIHAENDEDEVRDFIKFYGLQPDEIVEVPSRDDASLLETRTVFQALMQNIDIFGKPPKGFYEALAEFASNETEKKELLTLSSPEGATEFKRRAEVDTVTFADILLDFPSAHPEFHDIVRIVTPMKRREYSVASSQKVTPTSVALMIVVVNWVDPKGRNRFGQATRYLNKLKVGDSVTVSVKPSVMKLPPKSTQPLIMAGLGTGLAPFRAFVQYRAWQKAQGIEIGDVLLYMGSRHQREEYLYGEEWEAYQDAGVITLLGRAFSRDQPQKIYIQDRMRQTMTDIIDAYLKKNGSFYLCGPTWPVPDVTAVLEEAISRNAAVSGRKIDTRKEIERLKDDLRYVLEVY